MRNVHHWLGAGLLVLAMGSLAQGQVTIETVPVGNPGNADHVLSWTSVGGVDYVYNVGKFEVTSGQYVEFLNAVAATDTYGLYNTNMWDSNRPCKIQRTGSAGGYSYSVAADRIDRPVTYVSVWDAARFVNWLENGQPTGGQDANTTEAGSYALNGQMMDGAIPRSPGAQWVLPTVSEWHKAAYYDPAKPGGAGYWDYPTRSDTRPSNVISSPDGGNNANHYSGDHSSGTYSVGSPYWTSVVGEFEQSPSAYGTYDQGGNVFEWTEAWPHPGTGHVSYPTLGGSFESGWNMVDPLPLLSTAGAGASPGWEGYQRGFRVFQVPEPASAIFLAVGGVMVAWRKRRR